MSHSLRYTVNCSILFTELPLLERPEAARRAGFNALEFWWPFAEAVPGDKEIDAFVAAIENAGVSLTGLNFAAGDLPGGDRGLVSLPARSVEFRDNIAVTLGIGARLGCRMFNALYGNRVDGVSAVQQHAVGAANLAAAADAAARIGGTVLVEPVSGASRYPLRSAADALVVIDRARADSGIGNIGLLADLYHLSCNGDDVDKVIADHSARIAHVQIADHPGRGEPGTGELPLDRWLEDLEAGGYRGWVGLEYRPSGASVDSFDWLPHERRSTHV